ncbi:hypothetical protein SAMN02745216_04793 [Desulfatibacillum alkenivorans DSM 16219]|jgi:hypothetical protein|uniref:PA14 domain-containing protein n=1 Tax=Desulfatibacillum alkenivorans DSM 16219 TaxID=1121393 RepID=A0A1M6YP00_9BACT|nr:hypothetical protein [Desulfatibacillum alkenivorans]SHL19802.1 hypothetical protein SAMN02745216_04793 [Desulfatibacillum alkenivorans DSM 16219]
MIKNRIWSNTIAGLFIILFILTAPYCAWAEASGDSQALTDEGRALFFNHGEPEYSKVLAAHEKFEAAVANDSANQEARLFLAGSRLAAFMLEQGSGAGFETLRDLMEAFGMHRNSEEDPGEAPYSLSPGVQTEEGVILPRVTPGGEDVRVFLHGAFVETIDASLADLDAIDSSLVVELTPDELGDPLGLGCEMDHGDVLAFKAGLNLMKSVLLIASAYNMDVDIRALVALSNAGIFQFQRDVIDAYQDFGELLPAGAVSADGKAILARAKTSFLAGLNAAQEAHSFILAEYEGGVDDQGDEFLFIGSEEEKRLLETGDKVIQDLKDSLLDNTEFVYTHSMEAWILTDSRQWPGWELSLELERDQDGVLISGNSYIRQFGADMDDPPPNDDFGDALALTGSSGAAWGHNANASSEAGEPSHAGHLDASVWWTWTAPESGSYFFKVYDAYCDTVLAVYTGNSVDGLTEAASNDNPNGNDGWNGSELFFSASAGVVYHIAVDSKSCRDEFYLTWDKELNFEPNLHRPQVFLGSYECRIGRFNPDGEDPIVTNGDSIPHWEILKTAGAADGFTGTYTFSGPAWLPCQGTVQGTRVSQNTETQAYDLNRLFGNTGKDPLDVRDSLPEWDSSNDLIGGSFGGNPVLNGTLRDALTNDDLTRLLELQPGGDFTIPTLPIVIDGDPGDWTQDALVFTDPSGDGNSPAGTDLKDVYLAYDGAGNLCAAMTTYDGSPSGYNYRLAFINPVTSVSACLYADRNNDGGVIAWRAYCSRYFGYGGTGPYDAAAGDSFIEFRAPLPVLDNISGGVSGSTLRAAIYADDNNTHVRVDANGVITGEISCGDCARKSAEGRIYIYAYSSGDLSTAALLASAYVDGPGAYTLEGLPVGQEVYLYAIYDADGTGVKNFGDIQGDSLGQTIVTQEGTVSGIVINLDDLLDENDIRTGGEVYRVYGSTTWSTAECTEGGVDEVPWGDGWTLLGKGKSTQTMAVDKACTAILIVWGEEPRFYLDAFTDEIANAHFVQEDGRCYSTSSLSHPEFLENAPDAHGAWTTGPGYALFSMPGGTNALDNGAGSLKITLVAGQWGDVNGDGGVGLSDAAAAMQIATKTSKAYTPGPLSDCDGSGSLGLADALIVMNREAGVYRPEPIRTVALLDDQSLDFSTGEVNPASQADLLVQNDNPFVECNLFGLVSGGGMECHYLLSQEDFQAMCASKEVFDECIPYTIAWNVHHDAGKRIQFVRTQEGFYALIFLRAYDGNSLTIDYVYPYGAYSWLP